MNEITRRSLIWGAATFAAGGLLVGVERLCLAAFVENEEPKNDFGPVKIVKVSDDRRVLGIFTLEKVHKSKAEWKQQLTPLEYEVTRRAATEFPFSGALDEQYHPGIYRCIDCDNALFDSTAKFDSGTGWPSFWEPLARENVCEKKDFSLGVLRTELLCRLCDAHLGHVFRDGPPPTGLRYCINSAALRFVPGSGAGPRKS